MTEEEVLAEYRKLKSSLLDLGIICDGSLTKVFQKCGNPTCRCHQAKKYWHGPYFLWTRKVAGKTVTRKVPHNYVPKCREWIANNRRVNKIIQRMRTLALRVAPWNQ